MTADMPREGGGARPFHRDAGSLAEYAMAQSVKSLSAKGSNGGCKRLANQRESRRPTAA